MFDEVQPAHWIGLLDALGVLLALGLWLVLRDEAWARLRVVAGVCGTFLLLLAAGRAFDRLSAFGAGMGFPGFFSGDDGDRHYLDLALIAVFFVVGIAVGSYGVTSDDDVGAPDEAGEDEEAGAPEPPPIPARAWSRTEVLGDAPHDDAAGAAGGPGDPEAGDDDDVVGWHGTGLRPPWGGGSWAGDPSAVRGVAVPLLAVALGLGLPVQMFSSSSFNTFNFIGTGPHPEAADLAAHVLAGLLAGGALLGAAVALDVWERRLALASFGLLAVGLGLHASWPRPFQNEFWAVGAIALAAGLVAPATLRALRRMRRGDRSALVAGGAAALVLALAAAFATTYAGTRRFDDLTGGDGVGQFTPPDDLASFDPGDFASFDPGDLGTFDPGDLATFDPGGSVQLSPVP